MLLELPVSSLTQLLKNQEALKEAVEEEIKRSEEVLPGPKSISKEKQELGEIIYEKLVTRYSTEASKLTEMLLQMEYRDLLRVMAEPEHLTEKVELAHVLQGETKDIVLILCIFGNGVRSYEKANFREGDFSLLFIS
nr:uncharacterized protein LOC113804028 isoform X2 [Penaeus vannamei]